MKTVILVVTALGLASCDTYQGLQNRRGPSKGQVEAQGAGVSRKLAVVTTKSVPQYAADSEQCEHQVAAVMGPPGPEDSLEALKRALIDQAGQKTISVSYVNQDRAMERQASIKSCLSHKGYLVKP